MANKSEQEEFEFRARLEREASAAPARSVSQQAGEVLRDIPRQVGLTARYGLEGVAQAAQLFTEPVAGLMRGVGIPAKPLGEAATSMADAIGLPSPRTSNERVIGDASRLVAGGLGIGSAASGLARGASGVTQTVLNQLASQPAQQAISAAGAGLAGGSVRESGGGPLEQFGGAVLGGIATPLAANALASGGKSIAKGVTNLLRPEAAKLEDADAQIRLVMQRQGVDWSQVAPGIQNQIRREAAEALQQGDQLDPAALQRLVAFRSVPGTAPTRGMLSQDPVQLTREKNLAKVGANSSDLSLQNLPALEGNNTRALLNNLDNSGARGAPDAYATGTKSINALQGLAKREQGNIKQLYATARDSAGRDVTLDGGSAMNQANNRLVRDNVGKLPPEVDQWMNDIATGKTPLTVDYQQQLVKNLYRKMQGAGDNGDLRHGLRIVREALDNAEPLAGAGPANPGNLPSVRGGIANMGGDAGEDSIVAFRAARTANREWQARIEGSPALRAVVDGVEPDRFVQRYITGQGATVADVNALRDAASASPEALQAIKQHLVAHLRSAATGQADDINKFRADSYNNALNAIGERKLAAFFSPEEIAQLRNVGRVSNYMSAQPAGSAVNNSNSGALMAGKALDFLDKMAGKVPFGDVLVQGNIRGFQQRQALSPANALASPRTQPPRASAPNMLMAPAIFYGANQSAQGQQ